MLLHFQEIPPTTLLSLQGVTLWDPLLVVFYGINLTPLSKELRSADPALLSPFYANDVAFVVFVRRAQY